MQEQILDDMALERQRGITIKARAVAMRYEYQGTMYEVNLIDTPGHVDFQYEVSRSLTCCEGALLLADAFQGVEAQTVATGYAAIEHDLQIIPVVNKIDLKHERSDEVIREMEQTLGIDAEDVVKVSAKSGINIDSLLSAIVERIPAPTGDPEAPLQAMIFDSHYDEYRGAVSYVRIMAGSVRKGQKVQMVRNNSTHDIVEIGQFCPRQTPCETLIAGQVGYLVCNIKSLNEVNIGDTITGVGKQAAEALPGYHEPKRMVYCGLYPSDGQDFTELRDALSKLADQRSQFRVCGRIQRCLGIWISMWVPWDAAHGGRSATIGAGVRCRSGPNGSQCDV